MYFNNYSVQLGHLGADPECRNAGDGKVVTIRVATSRRWTNKEGKQEERTFWRTYEAWNQRGEAIMARMKKGDPIYVVATPSNNKYEKDGVMHYGETHTIVQWRDLKSKAGTADEKAQSPDDAFYGDSNGDDGIPY